MLKGYETAVNLCGIQYRQQPDRRRTIRTPRRNGDRSLSAQHLHFWQSGALIPLRLGCRRFGQASSRHVHGDRPNPRAARPVVSGFQRSMSRPASKVDTADSRLMAAIVPSLIESGLSTKRIRVRQRVVPHCTKLERFSGTPLNDRFSAHAPRDGFSYPFAESGFRRRERIQRLEIGGRIRTFSVLLAGPIRSLVDLPDACAALLPCFSLA